MLVQTPAGDGPPPEPASNLLDLDIICVDDEAEWGGGANQTMEGEDSKSASSDTDTSTGTSSDTDKLTGTSSDTDNSSDFGDELENGEDTKEMVDKHVRGSSTCPSSSS